MDIIPFSKPYTSGNELKYIEDVITNGKQVHGHGEYTKKCQALLEKRYNIKKCLLTTSCTDALEMAALLIDIKPGDEVIVPSYTFVSTANAFALRGATIRFVDSLPEHPNMDHTKLEALINDKTKAIVPVHYGATPCAMDEIMAIANKHNIYVIEDAAQAIEQDYKGKQLGTIGHLGAFSFHDTKNISCGEGGALLVNHEPFMDRSEIIWEKGTNRSAFFKGQVDKYGWVDLGSSYLPSELNAAYLCAQLEALEAIQAKRKNIWDLYDKKIQASSEFKKPNKEFKSNAHIYYLMCASTAIRDKYIKKLKENNIVATFHYQPLEQSRFVAGDDFLKCEKSTYYSSHIMRLPLYSGMTESDADKTIELINQIGRES